MKLLFRILARWPVDRGLVLASLVGIVALAVISMGVIYPMPWAVVASMSVGQGLGLLAFLFFALSIGADLAKGRIPQPPPRAQEPGKS